MGLFKFLSEILDGDNSKEIEDELHDIYGYSRKRLSKMSDEEKRELWYEEEANDD